MRAQIRFSFIAASILASSLFSCAKDSSGSSSQSWIFDDGEAPPEADAPAGKPSQAEEWIPLASLSFREASGLFKQGRLHGPPCKSVTNGVEKRGVLWHDCSGIQYLYCVKVTEAEIERREKEYCNSDMSYDGIPYNPNQPEKIYFLKK